MIRKANLRVGFFIPNSLGYTYSVFWISSCLNLPVFLPLYITAQWPAIKMPNLEPAEIYMQSENDEHVELAEEWALKAAQLGMWRLCIGSVKAMQSMRKTC